MANVELPLASAGLRRLHRSAIEGVDRVRALLERARVEGLVLSSGMSARNRVRSARIISVGQDSIHLQAENYENRSRTQLFFSFEISHERFFFASSAIEREGSELTIRLPSAIYLAERRDLPRDRHGRRAKWERVELKSDDQRYVADVADSSYEGLGLSVAESPLLDVGANLELLFLEGSRRGEKAYAEVKHITAAPENGKVRIGLAVTAVPPTATVSFEQRPGILTKGGPHAWKTLSLAAASARAAPAALSRRLGFYSPLPKVEIVDYQNDRGQGVRGIVDRTGEPTGGTAVLIPPAWGRTKETLLPLAATLIESFQRAGLSLLVLRYDGTQRRGESFTDPDCRGPGNESLHFTYSQAAQDLLAGARFIERSYRPAKIILVTFSLAAIEGRRALSMDSSGLLGGWISVVGMVDVQSALRSVSGGVDYYFGVQQGVRFGVHELGGVKVNIDHAARDVVENRLGGFEDARRDMASIKCPVTWVHGRHDGWIDVKQVRRLLSAGDVSRRRLVEVATGHQLRTSREALETFQLVAEETAEIAVGRRLRGAMPDLRMLAKKQDAERQRAPKYSVRLKAFWKDYLLGREGRPGMEILTATSMYRQFMEMQVTHLAISRNQVVLDLGAGAGDFAATLAKDRGLCEDVKVIAVDFVREGLQRGAERLSATPNKPRVGLSSAVADLELESRTKILPFSSESFDSILASLVLSYVKRPDALMAELYRVLKAGGRLVISTPRRDADMSSLYGQVSQDLKPEQREGALLLQAQMNTPGGLRSYLNDAARLVALEESGRFQFFDPPELRRMARLAGFRKVFTQYSMGDPPQVSVLVARKP